MINLLSAFADTGPIVHVSPLTVWQIAGVNITNSILYGWLAIAFTCAVLIWAARQVTVHPQGGLVQFIEAGVDFVSNLVENAFDNKAIGRKYVLFFVTMFFFILFNNWLGLLPFVGEGFRSGDNPLLRPFTGDLNATFALGLFTMLFVYGASIKQSGGILKYLRHFFIGNPLNPMYFLIGLIEMITDLTRVLSLSLRLFLNVAIGEIVISVFAYLGHVAAPLAALPFTLLELGVGALQAYIFTVLATMYLAIAVNGAGAHSHDNLTEDDSPATIDTVHGRTEVAS